MTLLWHFSEEPDLGTFVPRDGKVWAIADEHSWLYWFPRDCPRATWWALDSTSDDDVDRWLDGDRTRRVAVIEPQWLQRLRDANVYAYRMPPEPFHTVLDDRFYVASTTVEALERIELGDLVQRHSDAGIDLRVTPEMRTAFASVATSTLDFSGIRL